MSFNLLPEEEAKKRKQSLEIDVSRGEGGSSQRIEAWDYLLMNNRRFEGPATVEQKYEISTLSAAMLWGVGSESVVGLDWFAGLSRTKLDIELTSGGISGGDHFKNIRPFTGVQLNVRPLSYLSIYGRGSASFIKFDDEFSFSSMEVGTKVNLMSNLSLFGGWRWWRFEEDDINNASDIKLKLSGPMAGLLLKF